MKLKLNNNEMLCIAEVLTKAVTAIQKVIQEMKIKAALQGKSAYDADLFETLMHLALLEEMAIDMQKRTVERREKYRVNWKPSHALAFFNAFNGQIPVTLFAGNLVQRMCDQINQKYS